MKDELRPQIIIVFVRLRAKIQVYLKYNSDDDKKIKAAKEFVIN